MLKNILSVSGKSGLYKLVSNGKSMIIAESIIDKKKIPVYTRDKVVSLKDISIYTNNDDDIPLREVLVSIKRKENNATASVKPNDAPDKLRKYMEDILPEFDKERVYPTDIKKIINWYNLLLEAGIDFEIVDETEADDDKENKAEE